jgi:hypothetical protein
MRTSNQNDGQGDEEVIVMPTVTQNWLLMSSCLCHNLH